MNDMLPSRKVIAYVLVPAITLVALWGLIMTAGAREQTPERNEIDILADAIAEGNLAFQDLDTDGDGLKDWQEFLYQTDERVSDTDGDGASDGNEVARGYDPLVPGTGTTTDIETISSDIYFYKQDPTLTKTDVLSRDAFTTYLSLKQSGGLGQEDFVARAIDQTIRESVSATSSISYTVDDITVTADGSASARRYYTQYSTATRALSSIQYDDVVLLAQYLYRDDTSALTEIAQNKERYEQFLKSLEEMSVPREIAPVHIELMNNLNIIISSLEGILEVDEDPLSALVYSQKLVEDQKILIKNGEALQLYFERFGL